MKKMFERFVYFGHVTKTYETFHWVKEHYEVKCVSWNVNACLSLHYFSCQLSFKGQTVAMDQLYVTVTGSLQQRPSSTTRHLWKSTNGELLWSVFEPSLRSIAQFPI